MTQKCTRTNLLQHSEVVLQVIKLLQLRLQLCFKVCGFGQVHLECKSTHVERSTEHVRKEEERLYDMTCDGMLVCDTRASARCVHPNTCTP